MDIISTNPSNRPRATSVSAAAALEDFAAGERGQKFPNITVAWRRQRDRVIVFFDFPDDIRRMIGTTNAIESLNSSVRKSVHIHGHFPNDKAVTKLNYLAIRSVELKWKRPPRLLNSAMSQFAIEFGEHLNFRHAAST